VEQLKISIITVCFNSESTICETIKSVLSQKYKNIEYIIVDGASTDRTLEIISDYKDDISTIISEPDSGLYDAMNKGIKSATGDFVGILNSDDVFESENSVCCIVDFLNQRKELDAVYSDLVYVSKNDIKKITRSYKLKFAYLWKMRFGFMIPHPTFYVRRDLFYKLGFYKTDYRVSADFELMLRFVLNKIVVARCPMVLVRMREGGVSGSGFRWIVHQNLEIVRACRENNFYTNIFLVALKLPFKLISRKL